VVQQSHIFEIVRDAIGIGVSGLAPLLMALLMAMTAVLRGWEILGIDKLARVSHRVGGDEGEFFSEAIVVLGCDLFGVFVTRCGCFIGLAAGLHGSWTEQNADCQAGCDEEDECSGASSIFARHLQ